MSAVSPATVTLAPTGCSDAELRPLALVCSSCRERFAPQPLAVCPACLGPVEPDYPVRQLPDREQIEARPHNIWRYREWLPFNGLPVYAVDTGWTPLLSAPRLANRLGVAECHLKVDAWSTPSQSFKDRVVATAINAAHCFGFTSIGCASTGNLANAVAAAAARAGLDAWIFVPADLEPAKLAATAVHGARLVRVRGSYDDVNRLCTQLADRFPLGLVNVNLRSYYGEGSRTVAFEIAEQLGWRLPSAVVVPMAGGSLVTNVRRGFAEFGGAGLVSGRAPRMYGAQAAGCAPIVRLFERGDDVLVPERPATIARSLAIGNPADGVRAAGTIRDSGGGAAAVDEENIAWGIRVLAELTGVFGETAAGVTVAAALEVADAGHFKGDDSVVLCITGHGLKTTEAVPGLPDSLPLVDATVRAVTGLEGWPRDTADARPALPGSTPRANLN